MPVRIHPYFWLSTVGLSLRPGATLSSVALWVLVVFVSILVHELGHAAAFRHFGWKARITLHGFGGLASADTRHAVGATSGKSRMLISAAGPLAGFAFAAVVAAVVLRLGYRTTLLSWPIGSGPAIANPTLRLVVYDVLFINVVWGMVNLLPVFPLDGGQIALELARARDPDRAVASSLRVSFYVATVAAVLGTVVFGDLFAAFLFGYLAIWNALLLKRQCGVGLASLTGVRWCRRRWNAWRKARSDRARATGALRRIEGLDDVGANPEVDKVVEELFDKVSKETRGRFDDR